VLKKFNYFDCTPVSSPMDTTEKLMPNNVGKLSRYTINTGTQHWQAIQQSTSGWVFMLGEGVISCASKKQTCITGSTMKSEFVALAAAGKEAKWLRNQILQISLWSKPIAPVCVRCDSAATLAMTYSQIYNGKSRHLGVKHSMICELITKYSNGLKGSILNCGFSSYRVMGLEDAEGLTSLELIQLTREDFDRFKCSIWEALGGNTRDLDSIWEEMRQDYNCTRSGF
ncbi:hypothetical protein Tco_1075497, partial [Tanacetum coccineum]